MIGRDGTNGLCYEHSPSEGIAVIELMEKLIKSIKELNEQTIDLIPTTEKPEKLVWSVNNELIKHIADASTALDKYYIFIIIQFVLKIKFKFDTLK